MSERVKITKIFVFINNNKFKFVFIDSDFPFNQPNFCPSTTWYSDGITFANSTLLNGRPFGIFIDRNNNVYLSNQLSGYILVWYNTNYAPTYTLSSNGMQVMGLFVTTSGDIYAGDFNDNEIRKWSTKRNNSELVMTFSSPCLFLFIDINNTIYCSMSNINQVAKKWLNNTDSTYYVIAGNDNGAPGSSNSTLYFPCQTYVDTNFNLYVADSGNNRIQKFMYGSQRATTVAGRGAPGTILLYVPYGITFDANGYIFITDSNNNRIVGSGPFGFRCLIGCARIGDLASDHLYHPRSLSFDSFGNIYVMDRDNNRTQIFMLASNSCSKLFEHLKSITFLFS